MLYLTEELKELDKTLDQLTKRGAKRMLEQFGVGPQTAATLLAVAESFFLTLKTGLVNHKRYLNREEAKQDIFEYIEVFYNHQRLHSTNDYCSPVDYEEMQKVV